MGLDGPQLQGIAAIIAALGAGGFFTVRGLRKQKAGVPATDTEIDRNLIEDRRELEAENEELRGLLNEERNLRLRQLDAAEQRRAGEARVYSRKIGQLVQQRDELAETTARNRRRFIEKYGEQNLTIFMDPPEIGETWSVNELRELKRLADDAAV